MHVIYSVIYISPNVHAEFKPPKSFQHIHYKSLLFAFRRSNVHPFPNTSPQARKIILLLLLICGDNSAAINPGPYSLPLQNPCTSCDGIVVRHNTLNNLWHCLNCDTINYAPHSPILLSPSQIHLVHFLLLSNPQ